MKKSSFLLALLALLTSLMPLSIHASSWKGNTLKQGTFYLYNVGAEQWFTAANGWGTQGSLTDVGGLDVNIKVSSYGEGYVIDTDIQNSTYDHYLGSNLFCDADFETWTFTQWGTSPITYTISNANGYLAHDGQGVLTQTSNANNNALWILVTREERIAAMAEATAANPMDVTFLIRGANFSRNDTRNSQWQLGDNCYNYTGSGGNNVNNCAESFHSLFTLSQDIKGIPDGTYSMTAQGFYRSDGGTLSDSQVPQFFLNDATEAVPLLYGTTINSMSTASTAFTAGNYTIDPIISTVTGETLTLGIRNTSSTSLWVCWDNFRLTYYGSGSGDDLNVYKELLAKAVTKAQTLEGCIPAAAWQNLKATIDTNNKTYTTAEEYQSATTAIQQKYEELLTLVTDYSTFKEFYEMVQTWLENKDDFADKGNAVSTLQTALPTINDQANAATNSSELLVQTNKLRNAANTFIGNISMKSGKTIDLTWFINNPTPTDNTNGWQTDIGQQGQYGALNTGSYNCAEFWNCAGASIAQTIENLPKGTYRLTVQAFTRDNMTATLIAGTASMSIAGVNKSEVNTLTQADTWFNAGNGVNKLTFNNSSVGDVRIALTADNTTPDFWMVWRSFKLELVNADDDPVGPTPTEATLTLTATGNGSITFNGSTLRNQTKEFTIVQGSNISITLTPDSGYDTQISSNGNVIASRYTSGTFNISNAQTDNFTFTFIEQKTDELDWDSATQANPLDITSLLENPDFEDGTALGWNISYIRGVSANNLGYQGGASYTNGDVTISRFCEAWRGGGTSLGDGSIWQEVDNLPVGRYRMEADVVATDQYYGGTVTGAYLYADTSTGTSTTSISTGDQAPQHFTLTFAHTDTQPVLIGIKTESTNANWLAFDNVRLYYLGNEEEIKTVTLNVYVGANGNMWLDNIHILSSGGANVAAPVEIAVGNDVRLRPEPNEGYVVNTLTVGGKDVTSQLVNGIYTIENVIATTTIRVTFKEEEVAETWPLPPFTLTAADLTPGNTYYLRNVGSGQFMTGANNWGTQISLGTDGLPYMDLWFDYLTADEIANEGGTKYNNLPGYRLRHASTHTFHGYSYTENRERDFVVNAYVAIFRDSEETGYVDWNGQGHGRFWEINKVGKYYRLQTYRGDTYFPNATTQYAGVQNGTAEGFPVLFNLTANEDAWIDWELIPADGSTKDAIDAYKTKLEMRTLLTQAKKLSISTTQAETVYNNSNATLQQVQDAYGRLYAEIIQATTTYEWDKASTENPIDVTGFIKNPSFEEGVEPWSNTISGKNTSLQTETVYVASDGENIQKFMESWIPSISSLGDGTISQTIYGLPAGRYLLRAYVVATNQQQGSSAVTGVNLFAGKETVAVATGDGVFTPYTLAFTKTDADAIIIGLRTESTTANWVAVDQFKLYYLGNEEEKLPDGLTIESKGNGTVTFNGLTVREGVQNFESVTGKTVTLTIVPDDGYHIGRVVWSSNASSTETDCTSNVVNGQLKLNNYTSGTYVYVEFVKNDWEEYELVLSSVGGGSVSYGDVSVENGSSTIKVKDSDDIDLQLTAHKGYHLDRVTVNNSVVTTDRTVQTWHLGKLTADTHVAVEYVPDAVAADSIYCKISIEGFGSVAIGEDEVDEEEQTIRLAKGRDYLLVLKPESGYRLGRLTMDGMIITEEMMTASTDNAFTYKLKNITTDIELQILFVENLDLFKVAINGVSVTFGVLKNDIYKAQVISGDFEGNVTIPSTFEYNGHTWTVIGIDGSAFAGRKWLTSISLPGTLEAEQTGMSLFEGCTQLAAIEWDAPIELTRQRIGNLSNPNMLYYVTAAAYAPSFATNVVVNGVAERIILKEPDEDDDALDGGFYCPKTFTARNISYSHYFQMETKKGICQGWESLVLPFTVSKIEHQTLGEIHPFAVLTEEDRDAGKKPFWLYRYTMNDTFEATGSIEANTPYIISMPNDPNYAIDYRLGGTVKFTAEDVEVKATDETAAVTGALRTFYPCFQRRLKGEGCYVLNIGKTYHGHPEGSVFIRDYRDVLPFEAYFAVKDGAVKGDFFSVFDSTTEIEEVNNESVKNEKWAGEVYDLSGRKMGRNQTLSGVYILTGKKVVIK
ncbi:MAG: hypothetical protein J6W75_03395 [Bacteroidaceae bacterium]|nr:hypothetical protein [Bacteroidaceae bacterium]